MAGKMKRVINRLRGVPEHETLDSGSTPNVYDSTSITNIYPTTRKVSLVQLTMEALPRVDNYRKNIKNLGRPSLGEIHGEDREKKGTEYDEPMEEAHEGHAKLGWIAGCLLQCMLNLWGVMLFLRLSWIVGQAGILQSLIIIGLSTLVCVITTLSLSAISTNGEVKTGGIYYIISRSLGPEFGAAIGVVFAVANAVAASMNTIGFCSSLNQLLQSYGYKIIDNGDNDTRIIGCIALVLMCVICVVGMEYEVKANYVLFVVIIGAIIDFLVGVAVGPMGDINRQSQGFVGFSTDVFRQNFGSDYRFSEGQTQNFVTVFAIFFPSVTGVQAGANISGDLKDPAYAIPKGTLLALLYTMSSYAIFVIFAGGAALRDATGNATDFLDGTFANCSGRDPPCMYGLQNDYSVMQLMSLWGPFIYAGCFAATLSTAITNVLSVPKILQALGNDRIFPGLQFFSKTYFKSQEPLRGYFLTYLVSAAFVLVAQLNAIAPLISNFYLASYGLMNFCTFHAAHVKPLGWRPTFKYYNKWLSLFGFVLCVAIMFIIDWISSLVTYVILLALYLWVLYRKPDVNWGSSTQAMTFKTALQSAHHLTNISEHVKNYRPQILVLTGKPHHRQPLLDLAYLITKHNSLLMCGEISQKPLTIREREEHINSSYQFLHDNKIKSFYSLVDGISFEQGAKALIQTSGLGKLHPNILMMGYKSDWRSCEPRELISYFNVLHTAFDIRMSVAIVRMPGGVNFSTVLEEEERHRSLINSNNFLSTIDITDGPGLNYADSNLNLTQPNAGSDTTTLHLKGVSQFQPPDSPDTARNYDVDEKTLNRKDKMDTMMYNANGLSVDDIVQQAPPYVIPAETVLSMSFFQRKHKKAVIDVWWLYDDGGLTILLPHIISIRHNWTGSKLRLFALTNRQNEMEVEERNMAQLMAKLRIEYTSLTMVVGITDEPKAKSVKSFNKILKGFLEGDATEKECMVTEEELETLRSKTNRQLRLKEMLQEHSRSSDLVVMSLPMPRKGEVSAPMYMAWIETITTQMPPFILIRGNHTSVLTFDA